MNKEEIFFIWAPEDSLWSCWAKPVLFAHLDRVLQYAEPESSVDASWSPESTERIALVLDLPGTDGVTLGIALAARGYRPVPLYNAIPIPSAWAAVPSASAVDVVPIVRALGNGAERLAQCSVAPDAPPAFLLDANRQGGLRTMLPNEFDNRSVSFTTDFPSANFLQANGISRVLLVQKISRIPQSDLAHTLRRWQDGGLVLERISLDFLAAPEHFEVAKPSWYGMMFQRVFAAFGFHRSMKGGFGGWVPDTSSGG